MSLSDIRAQKATEVNAYTRIKNVTQDDFNKPPYHSNTNVYAVPGHDLWIYSVYSNTTSQVITNLEMIIQVPTANGIRANVRPSGVAGGEGVATSFSNNNGQTWDYSPSGESDSNITHIKYIRATLPANGQNQSIQAHFYAPNQPTNQKNDFSVKTVFKYNGKTEETNTVVFSNYTKPEFNQQSEDEKEKTLTGTTEIFENPTPWTENTPVDINEEIGLRVYVRNVIPETQAENLKIRLEFPDTYSTTHTVKAYISADNSETGIS